MYNQQENQLFEAIEDGQEFIEDFFKLLTNVCLVFKVLWIVVSKSLETNEYNSNHWCEQILSNQGFSDQVNEEDGITSLGNNNFEDIG